MGLMLSVLVACVGVVELLTFFHRIRQNVGAASAHAITANDRDTLREGYIKDLFSLRNRIYNELQAAKENCLDSSEDEAVAVSVTEKRCRPQKADAAVASTSSSTPTVKNRQSPAVPVLRLASHEEIELQFANAEDHKKIRSRSPSPRRFLLTENEATSHVHHLPNRKFLVTENSICNNCLKKSKSQNDLPEFYVEEKLVHNATRYVLKDEHETVVAPCSLPKQFYLTECGLGQIEKGQLELSGKQCELTSEDFQMPKQESFARQMDVENSLQFRRSPSPYPALEISAPRNSICTELLENSIGIVKEEVEESYSRSHSPSPMPSFSQFDDLKNKSDFALERKHFSNPDFQKANQMMTVPQTNQRKSRSPSPKPKVFDLDDDQGEAANDFQVDANSNYLNDLDGLKGKKLKRNKKSIKKRRSGSEDDNYAPTTSETINENVAEVAKNLDKNLDREENKNSEPFWVRK